MLLGWITNKCKKINNKYEITGKIDFEFWIKDDEKFVTIEGNICGFEMIKGLSLSLSLSDEFIIEGIRQRQSFMTKATLGQRPLMSR